MQREKYEFQSLSTSVSNSPIKTERSVASLRGENDELIFVHLRTRVVYETDFQNPSVAITKNEASERFPQNFSQDRRRQLKRKRPKGRCGKLVERKNFWKIKLLNLIKSKFNILIMLYFCYFSASM